VFKARLPPDEFVLANYPSGLRLLSHLIEPRELSSQRMVSQEYRTDLERYILQSVALEQAM